MSVVPPPLPEDRDVSVEVQRLIKESEQAWQSQNFTAALQKIIAAPLSKDEKLKCSAAACAVQILCSIKEAEISKIIDSLSSEERTNCCKYVYLAMSNPGNASGVNYGALLKWQNALYDKEGVGIIMRCLTERKL